jgi:hypothetical protein
MIFPLYNFVFWRAETGQNFPHYRLKAGLTGEKDKCIIYIWR